MIIAPFLEPINDFFKRPAFICCGIQDDIRSCIGYSLNKIIHLQNLQFT